MKTIKFYDTSALLVKEKFNFEKDCYVISIITLQELEKLKISNTDDELKYKVRKTLRLLDENFSNFVIVTRYGENLKTNDEKILDSADYYYHTAPRENYKSFYFVTNDLSMKALAKGKLPENVKVISEEVEKDTYTGYKDIVMNDQEMSDFYSNPMKNTYNLLVNEYINVYNPFGECVDNLVWTGETHRSIKFIECNSMAFGKIKPRDIYQAQLYSQKVIAFGAPTQDVFYRNDGDYKKKEDDTSNDKPYVSNEPEVNEPPYVPEEPEEPILPNNPDKPNEDDFDFNDDIPDEDNPYYDQYDPKKWPSWLDFLRWLWNLIIGLFT